MAFRNIRRKVSFMPPAPVMVEVAQSQFDKDGNEHISYALVNASTIADKLPSPADMTIANQIAGGTFNPVSLDDFEVSNLDASVASDMINKLKTDE